MDYKIQIPEPCHEDWNQMTIEDKGRRCALCCKTVVDFTDWETTAIIDYLKGKKEVLVCGRFKNSQVEQDFDSSTKDRMKQIWFSNASFLKKIAAIILVAFGLTTTSCDNSTVGKADANSTDSIKAKETPLLHGNKAQLVDSLLEGGHLVGIVDRPEGRIVLVAPPQLPVKPKECISYPSITMGDVVIDTMQDSVTKPAIEPTDNESLVLGKVIVPKADTIKKKF
ncbi:hypothetical protein [Solitalea canadensis]|uniref:Uncharacterized protein n=1 Tax=Solitalea canadensis (strain ATCC 29591 / DSM 3403 / JCM 21819 / LMG 8368 / NBRC 15130 / NCIMB 12057 / USAM 9D) TaxID=929556 RepID=H8KLP5_SOLCM|nr:hypothetical protein [Solitalea canadensis]AFD09199.1 hypothetical protein Solca_4209 [Solitalea canadensis DSM 3403]